MFDDMKRLWSTLALALLVALALFVSGCSRKVTIDNQRIFGTYKGDFEGKTEILNGTYVLKQNPGGERSVTITGNWNLVPYGDEIRLALESKEKAGGDADVRLLGGAGGTRQFAAL